MGGGDRQYRDAPWGPIAHSQVDLPRFKPGSRHAAGVLFPIASETQKAKMHKKIGMAANRKACLATAAPSRPGKAPPVATCPQRGREPARSTTSQDLNIEGWDIRISSLLPFGLPMFLVHSMEAAKRRGENSWTCSATPSMKGGPCGASASSVGDAIASFEDYWVL